MDDKFRERSRICFREENNNSDVNRENSFGEGWGVVKDEVAASFRMVNILFGGTKQSGP
jgi:hypothetical protein